jgi:CheY-like chemotaxis protein
LPAAGKWAQPRLSPISGEEALDTLARETFDAVILDIILPGMSGLEVLQKLRSDPKHSQMPIIMFTCKGSETEKTWVIECELKGTFRSANREDWRFVFAFVFRPQGAGRYM